MHKCNLTIRCTRSRAPSEFNVVRRGLGAAKVSAVMRKREPDSSSLRKVLSGQSFGEGAAITAREATSICSDPTQRGGGDSGHRTITNVR